MNNQTAEQLEDMLRFNHLKYKGAELIERNMQVIRHAYTLGQENGLKHRAFAEEMGWAG